MQILIEDDRAGSNKQLNDIDYATLERDELDVSIKIRINDLNYY